MRRDAHGTAAIAFASLLLAMACATSPPPPSGSPSTAEAEPVTLEEAASGSEVTLAPGQELNLVFASNVTTGYQWELVQPAAAVLGVLDPGTYHESAGEGGQGPLAGRGGTSFRFRAVRSGTDTLQLVYRRPWEKEQPPARTFLLRIRVR